MSEKIKKFNLGIKPVLTNDFFEKKKGHKVNETQTALIELNSIIPNPDQPRKIFDKASLQELTDSIISNGLIQPIVVRKTPSEKYQLVSGERRLKACKLAGLTKISVVIKDISEEMMLEQALIENIQRENLGPIEEGLAYKKLLQQRNYSHGELAKRVGKARTTITNTIRLLALSDRVKIFLQEKKLEMGHGRALLPLAFEEQESFAQRIIEKQLTVRQTEALVKAYLNSEPKILTQKTNPYIDNIKQWEKGFEKALSTSVKIKLDDKGEGVLQIPISSPAEIQWFLDKVSS